ncbi:protein kinase [Psychrobacillus sp. FJAT-51614]|uniref:Protein kinase n=1 Tax=Psychrobacillus mangrovi TaxID=3117745 RepID=A0ABU8FAI3_9BACI
MNHRYEVLDVIGKGSYGILYRCKDLKTNNYKVIKQLRRSKHRTKKEIKLFENEISILQKLNHENMPKFYETFTHDELLFYVMNYIEGDNLEDLIFYKKVTFNEEQSLILLVDLLVLIDDIHSKNIYHGDLRIPNIIVNNNQLLLIDFGLSKQNDSSGEMKEQDYYDLGEILLYLLYTTYPTKKKKALPWTEELSLKKETVHLLKRLLQIEVSYSTTKDILKDLQAAILANKM